MIGGRVRTSSMIRIALILGAILHIGCGAAVVRPDHLIESAENVLASRDAIYADIHSLRATTRVDERGGTDRVRGTVMMFAERPNHVRFDAMTQFGPVSILTSDGREFRLLDLRQHRFLSGPTCPSNIARFIGISLSDADIDQVLLGGTPTIAATSRELAMSSEGYYRATLHAADGSRQEIDLAIPADEAHAAPSAQHPRLVRSEVYAADGHSAWRVRYSDYKLVHVGERDIPFPMLIAFEDPDRQLDARIRFEEIDLNIDVPEGAFTQEAPPGVQVESAPCVEAPSTAAN